HPDAARVASIFENQGRELCVLGGASPNIAISRFEGRRFASVPLTLPHGMSYWGWGWYQIMFQDHYDEWWMSTGQRLVRYPRLTSLEQLAHSRPKAIYTTREGLPTDDVFRLYEDSRGDIWISTLGNRNGVLTRWERSSETFHRYSPADGVPDH